ncbi:MAG TPA: hypothetical protein PKK61_11165 [Defluviitaleaceae bacterium]|nr:hypothetical protein [Defluviitaleaceae bacterium]
MKVLFVSMVAFETNASATIQNKGIIRGLSALNYDIDIVTLEPDQNAISFDDSMNDIKQLVNNTYYIKADWKYALLRAKKKNDKTKTGENNRRKLSGILLQKIRVFIKKLYDQISIFDAQKINVKGISKIQADYSKYDLIISSSDPKSSHLLALRILEKSKNCKAKWIQYWGDPMLHDITRKSDWRDRIVKYYEKKLISKADRVIYASPLTLKVQRDTFPDLAHKMDYANQIYANVQNNISESINRKDESQISVGYFGAYKSTVRNILPLYNAAKAKGFKLTICGPSDIQLQSTDNIRVLGELPYNEATKLESESDILICLCNKRGTQIPGKIYYCTAYKKPIIVIIDGEYRKELKEFLKSFNRFILCENEEESIIKAIEKAKKQIKVDRYELSDQLKPKYMAGKIISNLVSV